MTHKDDTTTTPSDKNPINLRTVIVQNIHQNVTESDIRTLLKGQETNIESFEWPSKGVAKIILTHKRFSRRIIKKLRGEELKGSVLRAALVRGREEVFRDKKTTVDQAPPKCKLLVRNLPYDCSEEALRTPFEEFGIVKTAYIPTVKKGLQAGFGFVLFEGEESASNAMANLNGSEIQGRRVAIDYALPKAEYLEKRKMEGGGLKVKDEEEEVKPKKLKVERKVETDEFGNDEGAEFEVKSEKKEVKESDGIQEFIKLPPDEYDSPSKGHKRKTTKFRKDAGASAGPSTSSTTSSAQPKKLNDVSDGRTLFIRNLPERCVEKDCFHVFKTFGKVKYVKLLKSFGKPKGSGFVKFFNKMAADKCLKAVENFEIKIKDRKITVDVAVTKDRLEKLDVTAKPRKSDVGEGKTLFIRNISFDSTEEDVGEAFEEFGDIEYCRLVMKKDSEDDEHKGVGFVKFADEQSARKCLEAVATNGIEVDDRRLNVCLAVEGGEAPKVTERGAATETDDARERQSLHLLYEGRIKPGSKSAEGLSDVDMKKREKIEAVKKNKLKNPNMFVSDRRLVVHNIPKTVSETKLRKVFAKAGGKGTKLSECKIMKNLKGLLEELFDAWSC